MEKMKEVTTIKVERKVRNQLRRLKIIPRESYNSLFIRLLKERNGRN